MTPRNVCEREVSVTMDTPAKRFRVTEVEIYITPVHEPRTSIQYFDEIAPVYAPAPAP